MKEFWKTCPKCKGRGTVRAGDPDAVPDRGVLTGFPYPEYTGGQSGELTDDPDRSYCAICHGTGIRLK